MTEVSVRCSLDENWIIFDGHSKSLNRKGTRTVQQYVRCIPSNHINECSAAQCSAVQYRACCSFHTRTTLVTPTATFIVARGSVFPFYHLSNLAKIFHQGVFLMAQYSVSSRSARLLRAGDGSFWYNSWAMNMVTDLIVVFAL
eukprot:jgi/Psemu1/307088/fgenesh1_kg.302_\